MNNLLSPDAGEEHHKGSVLGQIWAFLNQDVRTFNWRGRKSQPAEGAVVSPQADIREAPAPSNSARTRIASEVDPLQIGRLHFRREVLDWRDDFHFQVSQAALQARRALAEQVEQELSQLTFFRRRMFAKPARHVLARHIESCVRAPFDNLRANEQAALQRRLQTWFPGRRDSAPIWITWPTLEWDTCLSPAFTPGNRERILAALGELIVGEKGLAARYRQRATEYAQELLEVRDARPDSV